MTEQEKLNQIKFEFEEGRSFLETKKQEWVQNLILLNNLQRPDETIGSTMLFSYLQRVHSNLYESKLPIKFEPNEDGEMSNVESLNKLVRADFQEMNMSMIEYDWLWDACFFGRGYVETINFNKKRKLLEPVVINPLMLIYDPLFSNPQDWRYYGKWKSISGARLTYLIKLGVITGIKDVSEIVPGMDEQVWQYKVQRENALNTDPQGPDSPAPGLKTGNNIYQIYEHLTIFDGKKTVVWTDKTMNKMLREEALDLNDDIDHPIPDTKDKYESKWPIVPREIFREPHSSVPISVVDLIQDKQRAKSVILNLAYIAAKDEVTPLFVYKEDDLTQPSQLLQRQIMQHISIEKDGDVNNTIAPLKKNSALSNSVLSFLNILGNEAADPIGTTQISPPVSKGKKSATGDALMQMVADLTASLQTKIIGASTKEFYIHWYQRYVNNAKDGDFKMISVTNSQFTTFETINLTELRTELPPKAIVFSAREAEFKESVERREMAQQMGVLQGVLSPEEFRNFLKYLWFPKFQTFDKESTDLILPKTQDEIKAEQENLMLAEGELPPISEGDNHEVHLFIHSRVKNTAAKWAHYYAHQKLLAEQKKAQAAAAQAEASAENTQGAGNKPNSKSVNPEEAAVGAKGMMSGVDKGITSKKQMS